MLSCLYSKAISLFSFLCVFAAFTYFSVPFILPTKLYTKFIYSYDAFYTSHCCVFFVGFFLLVGCLLSVLKVFRLCKPTKNSHVLIFCSFSWFSLAPSFLVVSHIKTFTKSRPTTVHFISIFLRFFSFEYLCVRFSFFLCACFFLLRLQ